MQTLLLKLILLESEALRFNRVPQYFFGGYRVPRAKKGLRTTALESALEERVGPRKGVVRRGWKRGIQ